MAVTDTGGRFLEVNRTLSEILRRAPAELRSLVYDDVVHPEDRPLEAERLAEVLAAEEDGYTLEVRYVRPDGDFRWVSIRASVAGEWRDVVVRRVLDVTAHRQVEADLRRSEERFRRVFEEGPLGMAISDPQRRILRVNPALCALFGYAEEELVGRTMSELTHPDDAGLDVDLNRRLLAGEIPSYEIEKRYIRRDGEVSARLWATLIHADDGQISRLVMLEDITEAKEADEVRRQLDALKDGFVRVVSHDLQGPLVTIAGLAGVLAGAEPGVDPEEQRHILRRIADQADRLQRMVATLLDLDRLYQSGTRAQRRPTDVAEVVRRVVEQTDLGDRPLTIDVPSLPATVDRDLVERIIENLLANASTHTPPGTPVWLRVSSEASGAVLIAVDDAGPGVPDHLKGPVFELFRTGDPDASRTGIGLWVVARLAELHDGRAWVEDRSGGGAAFRAVLAATGDEGGDAI